MDIQKSKSDLVFSFQFVSQCVRDFGIKKKLLESAGSFTMKQNELNVEQRNLEFVSIFIHSKNYVFYVKIMNNTMSSMLISNDK